MTKHPVSPVSEKNFLKVSAFLEKITITLIIWFSHHEIINIRKEKREDNTLFVFCRKMMNYHLESKTTEFTTKVTEIWNLIKVAIVTLLQNKFHVTLKTNIYLNWKGLKSILNSNCLYNAVKKQMKKNIGETSDVYEP